LQPTPATAELELRDVELTTGAEVRYPTWVLTRRGHDLLPAFQSAFGAKAITPPNLRRLLQRVRLVPMELLTVMRQLLS
jgi:hypothetical protein